eukprot:12911000-Prorocentrum_lima.AAC.1
MYTSSVKRGKCMTASQYMSSILVISALTTSITNAATSTTSQLAKDWNIAYPPNAKDVVSPTWLCR